jgi:hypothetical protein
VSGYTTQDHFKTNTFMSRPSLALFNLGGGELLLILMLMFVLAFGAAVTAAVVYLIVRASQKKSGPAQPFQIPQTSPPAQPQDLDQQLRALAKLRDDGVITEEDFTAKKKALLGL